MGHCNCCANCSSAQAGTANSGTTTSNTPSASTVTVAVPNAATPSQNRGIRPPLAMSPYWDLLTDLLLILHGEADGYVDVSPFLKLAAQALEYEMADRLMDLPVVDPRQPVN